jgi:energy-coupling factor transport system permease protein
MTISLAIRFVPSLLQESQKILNAQASRGVDFGNGNILDKGKALISLIIPMFSISVIKSNDLAFAMEVKSYDPRRSRTNYRTYKIQKSDFIILALITSIFGFLIMMLINHDMVGYFAYSDILLKYRVI